MHLIAIVDTKATAQEFPGINQMSLMWDSIGGDGSDT